jgi:hypothetical protein
VEVAKSKKAPEFAMAGERAKIGAALPRFGLPVGGSPARAVLAAAAAFVAARVAEAEAARFICSAADDEGVRHVLQIPDTYFVASYPMRLLSPQHYSQQIHDHRGTYSTNFGDQVVFVFHKKKIQVTITLSSSSNVGILSSAPGHQVFSCCVEDA